MTFSADEVRKFVYGFAILMSLYLFWHAGHAAVWMQLGHVRTMTDNAAHWLMVYSAIPSFWLGAGFMRLMGKWKERSRGQ